MRKILALALLPIALMISGCGEGQGAAGEPRGDVHGAWAYMQLFVEERLAAPGSADFPFGGHRHVTDLGGGRYQVQSYVDAQNAFGAQVRTRFEGVIKRTDGAWELETLRLQ